MPLRPSSALDLRPNPARQGARSRVRLSAWRSAEIGGLPPFSHLALLRAHRLVEERRDGRNHFYRLAHPYLADWILDALPFVDIRKRLEEADHIDAARALWSVPASHSD